MEITSFRNINTTIASASVDESLPTGDAADNYAAAQYPVVLSTQCT